MVHKQHLIPSNLDSHFFIKPPAEGTDLARGSDDVLELHGLPRRPDPRELPDFGEVDFTRAAAVSGAHGLKTEIIAAASDSKAIVLKILADDGHTLFTDEVNVAALQVTFQQSAVVQAEQERMPWAGQSGTRAVTAKTD
jgi:hypothetical protein